MKKYFILVSIVLLLIVSMSFSLTTSPQKKTAKNKIIFVKTPQCDCGQPTNVTASLSGGTVSVSWSPVANAVTYSVGGYYSCGGTFAFCVTGTSHNFSAPCGGTLRITANCAPTTNNNCINSTCSGTPSAAVPF
jgi:hypothetical protein